MRIPESVVLCAVLSAVLLVALPVHAKDAKFVGVWEGNFDTPIYTKLVLHEDNSLTYCDVSSCHYVNCKKMEYTGSFGDRFRYADGTGSYEFHRVSDEEIEATFVNVTGDISNAYYEPE